MSAKNDEVMAQIRDAAAQVEPEDLAMFFTPEELAEYKRRGQAAKASTERRTGPRTAFWVFCAMTLGLAAAIEDEDTVEPR